MRSLALALLLVPASAQAPDAPPPELPVLDDLDLWAEGDR